MVDECNETVEEVKLAKITSAGFHSAEKWKKHKCSSCTLCIVLFSKIFTINIGIGTYFDYYKYMNRKKDIGAEKGFNYQTTFDYWSYKMATEIKSINIKNH